MYDDYDDLCCRVAREVAKSEDLYDTGRRDHFQQKFEEALLHQYFLPAGNTLLAGKKKLQPNCCILGKVTDDNFEEIRRNAIDLWRNAIGIGFDLSGLSDPVEGLKTLSRDNAAIDLGHRPQRGNMAVLRLSHPKHEEFVHCKTTNPESIYNFNISLAVTDKEMERALGQNSPTWLHEVSKGIWKTGDPGVVFIDRANASVDERVKEQLGELETCVPCGEQFMHTGETCNLGSLNLPAFYDELHGFDEDLFQNQVRLALRFLDNVVDLLDIPNEEMRKPF